MSTERPTHHDAADKDRDGRTRDDRASGGPADDGTPEAHGDAARGGPAKNEKAPDPVAHDAQDPGEAVHDTQAPRDAAGTGDNRASGAPEADPDAHPGRSQRRSRLAIGSVAVAVLLVGGGGAYIAATSGHDGAADSGATRSGADGNPPRLALDGYPLGSGTTAETPGATGTSGTSGIAPGEPDPNGVRSVLYRAVQALPHGPSSAQVYRSGGTVTADQVTRLAKALGVGGTPRLSAGSWLVGGNSTDMAGKAGAADAGPALRVTQQAPGTWTFSPSTPGTDDCARATTCSGDVTGGQTGRAVSESAAKAAAAPVLKALGQDDAKLDARQLMGSVRVVNADPEVGGLPTYGWSTGIQVGTDGKVTSGSGRILAPVKGDTYPVLDADKTLDLLNKSPQGRVSPGACPNTDPQQKQKQDGTGRQSACGQLPAKSSVVPVRGATFGLATHFVAGRPALVPSWLFEVRPQGAQDSYTLTYPAVDPKYLADDAGAGAGSGGTPSTAPGDGKTVHLTGYTTSGRSLTAHFYGGMCSTYTAAAAETGDKVTVTVTDHKKDTGKVCIMIAKEFTRTVTLKQPIDDRKVVDGTGATVRRS